ncbi:MAG: methylmalonyl-CoA mutase family protein, partial [Dehalococcoidia bacterium]
MKRLQQTQEAQPPQRERQFTSLSHIPVEQVYTPAHLAGIDDAREMGLPGEYPYLRGVHASGYRGKLWTMRM